MADVFCNLVWGQTYYKISEKISKDEYKEFIIPKKNGVRIINYLEPTTDLYKLQKQLCVNFLDKQSVPLCVKGFIKGENYLSFLKEHIGSNYFLRVDIKSFFPSITKEIIEAELRNIFFINSEDEKDKLSKLVSDLVTLNNSLPQGACTSPVISNLIMRRLDQRILKYCQALGVIYTRYADDLLFSSDVFNFSQKNWFLKKIKHILKSQKFKLNYSKIKFGNGNLSLNGYVISKYEIKLSRHRLSDIRHTVSFAQQNYSQFKKNGDVVFLQKLNEQKLSHRNLELYPFNTVFQFVQYLCGYRAYLISLVDINLSTPFQKEIKKLIRKIEKQILLYNE